MTIFAVAPNRQKAGMMIADVPLAIVPALAALVLCGSAVDAMSVLIQIPDELLAIVTYHAATRTQMNHAVMRALIQLTGIPRLRSALGNAVTHNITTRFALPIEAWSHE